MKKLVMIDDDPDDQIFYERLFKEQDKELNFEAYSSVEQFLEKYIDSDDKPNLILLDLNMPRIGGIDLIRSVNVEKGFRNSPIIVFTTSSSPLDMEDCKKLGVQSYFIKPLNYEDCKELTSVIYQYWFKHNNLLNIL